MTLAYKMIDDLITEMFGQPDPALGGFVLDHGNLQAFAARIMVARIMVASPLDDNPPRGCGKENAETPYGYRMICLKPKKPSLECGKENAETSYGYREYCPEWVKNQKPSFIAREK
jgi:hypothetical protein